jgi:inosose dehydratase
MPLSRREFLATVSAACVARTVGVAAAASGPAAAGGIVWGYAAITWGEAIEQAIDDVSAVGFHGIQLRANAVTEYGQTRAALRDLLQQHHLELACLSSGNLSIDPAKEQQELTTHVEHAKFVRDLGGKYLQVIDERPKRTLVDDDYRRLGRLMTELGKRTADVGIPLVYHHHMNSTGERPEEIAKVLAAADPRHVGLLFDCAHYQQGGGDPVKAVHQYRDWLKVLHIKDVESPVPGATGDLSRSYRFVELGRGEVDLPAVWKAIEAVKYQGWSIVELDRVPDNRETPKEAAAICRRYLEGTLKLAI